MMLAQRAAVIEALLADATRASELSPADAARLLVGLSSVQAALAARVVVGTQSGPTPAPSIEDRLLTPEQLAKHFGCSKAWVYRQAPRWPFTRKLSRRVLRFSEAGLLRYVGERRARG